MSMELMELPVKVGDVYWLPEHNSYQKTTKCSVCCGHKSVWVRNIEGDEFEVRCEGCGKGYNDPQGVEISYVLEARATKYVVGEIKSIDFRDRKPQISLSSTTGRHAYFDQLKTTEAEALAESQAAMDRLEASNMAHNLSRKKSCLPEHAWSVHYHNSEIKEAERRIAWHKTRLLNKKIRGINDARAGRI